MLKVDDLDVPRWAMHLNVSAIERRLAPGTYPGPERGDYVGKHVHTYTSCRAPDSGCRRYHFGKVTPGSYWDGRVYTGRYVPSANGGDGYLLSRRAAEIVAGTDDEQRRAYGVHDDVMVGNVLYDHGIKPTWWGWPLGKFPRLALRPTTPPPGRVGRGPP